ncbi:DUF4142 domain-containing protein [Ancylothrix sp. C2]|uniref:DUF4142 domain-containing protein n=1 Tax=Ancylothrix sp. D3o TaxID=2953691 RepID=UPI0021BA4564|nr:DUF4142 domain-containing protein [Ancylothrix sp. D3o]MCT7952478.1 DUF4142 domain-containing protein [Ancylothrix sp. D3o]
MTNNSQKRLTKKIAGILGLASISSLIGLPVFAMTANEPVLSKNSNNQTLLAQQDNNNSADPTTSTQECFVTPARGEQLPEYCSQVAPAYDNEANDVNNSDQRMNQGSENMPRDSQMNRGNNQNMPSNSEMNRMNEGSHNMPSNSNMNRQNENMPSSCNMTGQNENMSSSCNMNRQNENMPSNSNMNRQSTIMPTSDRINSSDRQSATFSYEDCFVTPTRDNSFPAFCSQVVPAYENEVSGSNNSMMNRQASSYEQDSMMNRVSENPSNDSRMNQGTENSLEENNMTPEVEQIIEDRSRVPGSSNTPENSNRSDQNLNRSDDVNRSNAVSQSDRMFMMQAARDNMAEVQLGQMAVQKASSEAVREYGQRMVDHHTQANRELMQLASQKGVTLPSDIGDENREMMSRLSQLSGAEFDRTYMQEMVRAHNKDLSLFQRQAQDGQDSDLKSWAAQKVPTLQNHLAMARNRMEANRNNDVYR